VLVIQEAGGVDVYIFEFVNMSGKCRLGVQLRIAVAFVSVLDFYRANYGKWKW
jgi:hypothetical protein